MGTDKPTLLVVEDDELIGRGLVDLLSFHGHAVTWERDGVQGLATALARRHDLLVLDLMLPGIDGLEICRRVRAEKRHQPILMLTAKGAEQDVVRGLSAGADDYVTKPFSTQELTLRIAAILRRSGRVDAAEPLAFGDMVIDGRELVVVRGQKRILLTRRECELLAFLVRHRGELVTRTMLLIEVWGYPHGDIQTRTVDIHIAKLRRKLELDPESPQLITTVHGEGYRLVAP